jgi:hypothetical protein
MYRDNLYHFAIRMVTISIFSSLFLCVGNNNSRSMHGKARRGGEVNEINEYIQLSEMIFLLILFCSPFLEFQAKDISERPSGKIFG